MLYQTICALILDQSSVEICYLIVDRLRGAGGHINYLISTGARGRNSKKESGLTVEH